MPALGDGAWDSAVARTHDTAGTGHRWPALALAGALAVLLSCGAAVAAPVDIHAAIRAGDAEAVRSAAQDADNLGWTALAGGEPYLQKVAAGLGADMTRLQKDLRDPATQGRIAADLKESERYKFDGVPAFVIDGQVIEGAQPAERFFETIDKALRQ